MLKDLIDKIDLKIENEFIDFKRQYYHESKKYDLLKDILAFANCHSNGDKYIVFGIDNDTRGAIELDYSTLPDISSINELIKEYCEPFVDITIRKFDYNDKKLAALIIKDRNLDRPYIVRKDFKLREKTKLYAGDIYVRKNANNFKATRTDIDNIYNNKDRIDISIADSNVYFKELKTGRKVIKACCLRLNIINNSLMNFGISEGQVLWQYPNGTVSLKILFIEDYSTFFLKELNSIENIPFNVQSKKQYKKMVVFEVSEEFRKIIESNEQNGQKPTVTVELFDVKKNAFKITFDVSNIQ